MATVPKLVNKQFNSPIKLYSQQNVKEVLDKESQLLANGAVGIDFHQLAKPANLKNSAVLRMLEEEENRKRNGHPDYSGGAHDVIRTKRLGDIIWPPQNGQKGLTQSGWASSKCFIKPGAKQVIWPPPADSEEFNNNIVEEAPVYAQGGPQFQQTSPQQHQQQQAPQQQRNQPLSPNFQQPQQQQQQQQKPPLPQQQQRWAPVQSPVVANPQSPSHQQQYQPPSQQQHPVYRPPVAAPEPPPATIVLRPEPPISQAPAPIITSQPATASLNGGNNMRGDQKWPPATVKAQMQDENEQRKQLAKGPVFRPRKVKKDYSNFFAQHALNSTYPGYRAPPGTQYYAEGSGVTEF